MGIISRATESASGANGVVASAGLTAYSFSTLPWSSVATVLTICLTLFYLYGAIPRMWRTTVALKRGIFNKDWSLFQKLGDQPMQSKDE